MLDISLAQILVIAAIALMVVRPEKMVGTAREVAKFVMGIRSEVAELKHEAHELRREIQKDINTIKRELELEDIQALKSDFQHQLDELEEKVANKS